MMPLIQAPGCPCATGAMAKGIQAALPTSSFALMQGFCIHPPPQRRNLWALQVASRRLQSLFQPRCNLSRDFNLFKLRVSACFSLAAGLAKATQELHTASLQQANFCCRLHLCKQDVFRLLPKHQLCKLIIFSQHPTPTWVTSLVLTKLQNGDCGHYLTLLLFMMYEGKSRGSSFQITSSVCLAGS